VHIAVSEGFYIFRKHVLPFLPRPRYTNRQIRSNSLSQLRCPIVRPSLAQAAPLLQSLRRTMTHAEHEFMKLYLHVSLCAVTALDKTSIFQSAAFPHFLPAARAPPHSYSTPLSCPNITTISPLSIRLISLHYLPFPCACLQKWAITTKIAQTVEISLSCCTPIMRRVVVKNWRPRSC